MPPSFDMPIECLSNINKAPAQSPREAMGGSKHLSCLYACLQECRKLLRILDRVTIKTRWLLSSGMFPGRVSLTQLIFSGVSILTRSSAIAFVTSISAGHPMLFIDARFACFSKSWCRKMTSLSKRVATNLLGLLYLSPAKTISFLL